MAKNSFQAKTAEQADPNYNGGIGNTAAQGVVTGQGQQAQGFGEQGQVLGQQLGFAQMLQQQAQGGGPQLATQQIKDATARNNANAAGLAASSKSSNPATAAREALMAAAGSNQAAAGQVGQTSLQQQLMAQQELGGALQGASGTAAGRTGAGTALTGTTGAITNTANANLNTGQNAANQVNEQVAAQNASTLNSAIGGLAQGAGAAFGLSEGGEVPGMASGGPVGHIPRMPMPRRSFAAQVAHHLKTEYFDEGGPVKPQPAPVSPVEEAKDEATRKEGDVEEKRRMEAEKNAAADTEALGADAGKPKGMAAGGEAGHHVGFKKLEGELAHKPGIRDPGAVAASIGRKKYGAGAMASHAAAGKSFAEGGEADDDSATSSKHVPLFDLGGWLRGAVRGIGAPTAEQAMARAQGAPLPAGYVPPPAMAWGGRLPMMGGGGVPGHAQVPGNSPKNDTVPAELSPGEVVLPRSISHDPKAAAAFVDHLRGAKGKKKKKDLKGALEARHA